MAYPAQGTKFFWSTSTSYSTARQINEVTDFTGPGGQAADVDISHLGSTAKEFFQGLRDEGEVSLSLNFNATDAGQAGLIADRATRTMRKATIKYPDAATHIATFDAYCKGFSISGAVDNKISAQAVLRISGAVTYSTG